MSQAEIENELRKHGSGFQDGKQRIIELYQTQPDRKLRAKALAKEYGIGGHSQDFLDGSSGFVNHDGKGLEFDHYPDHQKVTLSWTQVEKYIDLMIQSDRYLTDKEKEHRAAVQEAERQLPMLDGDAAAEYNALKEQYPNTLIGFELGGYFLFYDKDAITVKEVFRSNLLSQENALGKVKVTGFLRREWVAKSQKLWAEGNSIYLAGQGGDGTHHQTKYLREEDYLPIGIKKNFKLIKDAYAAQHKEELDAFNKAVRTLMKLNGSTTVDFSALDAEFSALQSGSAELRSQLEALQPDLTALKNIRKYIDMVLNKQQLSASDGKTPEKESVLKKLHEAKATAALKRPEQQKNTPEL